MIISWESYDQAGFAERLRTASQRALLLDYDGTLAPFHIDRYQAVPYPGVRELLDEILDSNTTRLIIVSGRQISDLPPLLGLRRLPELWGSHGWERRWPDGRIEHAALDARAQQGLDEARAWLATEHLIERSENKPFSVALHWRGLSPFEMADLQARALAAWQPIAERSGLDPHQFDGGIELRAPGRTKGHAVTTILSELQPDAFTAYLGDDQTDEDAFRALGSQGLSALVRTQLRPTAAHLWLQPPEELLAFLQLWLRATQA